MFSTYDDFDSSPDIGSDGTIYVGNSDGYVYAIYSDCGGLVPTHHGPCSGIITAIQAELEGRKKRDI